MPVSRKFEVHPNLRAYLFHGVTLTERGAQAIGDCPFCGREGKFSVEIETSKFKCWHCGSGGSKGGGNALGFTRLVYENAVLAASTSQSTFYTTVASERGLLQSDTVVAWGIACTVDGTWLVPGYGPTGQLDQVYRRTKVTDKGEWVWRLLPTPGIWPEGKVHALHLPYTDFDPNYARPNVVICEGPWDGMALWETAQKDEFGQADIIAVPGCNVWRQEWTEFCRGKNVILLFDSDHPKEVIPGSDKIVRAGYDGMTRVAKRLSGVAASVRWLRWGPDGYDQSLPSGWDIRDTLKTAPTLDERRTKLVELLSKIEDAPREWFSTSVVMVNGQTAGGRETESMPCSRWDVCEEAWREAMFWRKDLKDALAILLAICASTSQAGNQLFLDLIGSPGSAKTTLCQGLLVSNHCVRLENVTKLLSGWKKPGEEGVDCSFLARANNKTWVTCEFDVLGSSPQYHELMGKVRRIFDGETSTTYGNDDKDRIYTALRTPWIRAGTQKMMDKMADHDQSQLGDRFIRFIIGDPDDIERRNITRRALRSERAALVETVNCTAGSMVDSKTRLAHALTGGYVDWLRANAESELNAIEISEAVEDYCIDLAELSADLRARPCEDKRKVETHNTKELPTRLARQNIRLATCLAVALNKPSVDAEVLRIVRKVALDTATGHSLRLAQWLCSPNKKAGGKLYQECGGIMTRTLEGWMEMNPERMQLYLKFLRGIGVIEMETHPHMGNSWLLTDRVYRLFLKVMAAQ